jgi:hypothetical protein
MSWRSDSPDEVSRIACNLLEQENRLQYTTEGDKLTESLSALVRRTPLRSASEGQDDVPVETLYHSKEFTTISTQ